MSRMERGSWVGPVHQHAIVVLAVLTLDAHGVAHVGIQQIHVGEHTLVTLLGLAAVETRRRDTAADTELQTGALLTHLGQRSGRR